MSEVRYTQELAATLSELAEPTKAAEAADLCYVSDETPGIRRARHGRGWSYYEPDGSLITDPALRARLEALVIPPAWTEVWICPQENGHILVTGRDDKGRKQYIYHPRWQELRNQTKFNRMILFGRLLPRLREQTDHDLRKKGLPREKILAAVVRLLEETLIRVGNNEYAITNDTFGLTTLKDWHTEINGSQLTFEFRGKSGKVHTVNLRDRRVAKVVQQSKELPGYELFQYLDENGDRQRIDSSDVNNYLREITGEEFSAKDFRTWGGSVLALRTLLQMPPADDEKQVKKNMTQAVKEVARSLGNTPAVTRQYYIHPAVLDYYQAGTLNDIVAEEMAHDKPSGEPYALKDDEAALIRLLRRRAFEE